jgi:hypothetical protein
MPDTKITALTAISTVDPAVDVLPIVDVSDTTMAASGTTKKVTLNQLLATSPTATLASATITGDLTVRTTGLVVNSTGTGVQVSPSAPLCVKTRNSDSVGLRVLQSTGGTAGIQFTDDPVTADWGSILATSANVILRSNSFLQFQTGGATERMRIDSAGNVGISVTPSAWASGFKAIDISTVASFTGSSTELGAVSNAYFNGTNYIYKTTNLAALYRQQSGVHTWWNAPSGTAGNAITFTQAMTLDVSGDLLVGTTLKNGSWNTKLTLSNDSGTTRWAVGPYLGGVTNFLISAGAATGVYLNGTAATSWTSASDERLKDIIEPISNAVAKVGSLRAVIGKFKFDELNTRKPFLIAQDVQAVLPEAVDASNPDKLGVAYTDVIPLLVAAIKELTARVQTLEAR